MNLSTVAVLLSHATKYLTKYDTVLSQIYSRVLSLLQQTESPDAFLCMQILHVNIASPVLKDNLPSLIEWVFTQPLVKCTTVLLCGLAVNYSAQCQAAYSRHNLLKRITFEDSLSVFESKQIVVGMSKLYLYQP